MPLSSCLVLHQASKHSRSRNCRVPLSSLQNQMAAHVGESRNIWIKYIFFIQWNHCDVMEQTLTSRIVAVVHIVKINFVYSCQFQFCPRTSTPMPEELFPLLIRMDPREDLLTARLCSSAGQNL